MNRRILIATGLLVSCCFFDFNACADNQNTDAVKNPAPVRHYRFGEVKDNTVKNPAGDTGNLVFTDFKARPGEPFAQELRIVPGRRPGTKAVRIDQCSFLDMKFLNPAAGVFSFVCWVKMRDYGKLQSGGGMSGTIVTVGSGYYGGWRVIVSGSSRQVNFQIGSMKPEGGSYLAAGVLAPEVWQHVAVTCDGRRQSVYIDGKLAGEKAYTGDYVSKNEWLVIGYSGHGTGSLDMEIDEAAIYDRALTAEEIAGDFNRQP